MKPREKLISLVTFSILMENNSGIIGKAPAYILEKIDSALGLGGEAPIFLLDMKNFAKFEAWMERWMKDDE